jgi:hypothetical protein
MGAVLLLAMAGFGVAAASPGDSAGTIDVSLEPANQTVGVGGEVTYDIVVEGATEGVSGYTMTIGINDSSTATFTNFEHNYDPLFDNTEVDNDTVNVSAAMGSNIIEGNDTITLGTVTVAGDSGGETALSFAGGADGVEIADENDSEYDVAAATGGTLQVDQPEVDVGLAPAEQAVGVEGQTEYELVAEGPTEGISAYILTLELDNSSVANIEGFEHTYNPEFDNTEVDNDTVNVSAAMGENNIAGSDEIVLGTLNVSGQAEGVTDLAFAEETIDIGFSENETVKSYATGAVTDGSLQVTADGEPTTVELVPLGPVTTGEVDLGVVVTGADNGIGAYDIDMSSDSAAVTFADWELTAEGSSGPLDNSEITDNGTSFSLSAALLDAGHEPANETQIATVTVAVDEPGTHSLGFGDATIQDLDSSEYTMTTEDLSLDADSLPPVGGGDPPTDVNGDGLYEDVDGDGSFDIFDVQALFDNLDSDAVQNNPAAYNFNDDENPQGVTIFDVQGLFDTVGNV